MVTKFDIDLIDRPPIISVCSKCKCWIKIQEQNQDQLEISVDNFCDKCVQSVSCEKIYWVRCSLTDSTGNVDCRINTKVCSELLGFAPEEFMLFSVAEKSQLKWKVLLENYVVYFSVFKTKDGRPALKLLSVIPDRDDC